MWYTLAMQIKRLWGTRILILLLATIMVAASSASCKPVQDISEVAETITQDLPSAEDTLVSMVEINEAVMEAMSRGEEELTFNAAGISEEELKAIGTNLSTFWGKPVLYTINREFEDVEGIIPGRAVNVKNITNTFELSNNYYVYDLIRNGVPIPEDKRRAQSMADALHEIALEVFPDSSATDYDKTLAAHDWLVANIEYDDTISSDSEENGSFGAIVLRRTMCQGYAEALELLLKCYTDIEITQIVGEALNVSGSDVDLTETEDIDVEIDSVVAASIIAGNSGADGSQPIDAVGEWGGHAWNLVKFNGAWYHIDTTFDDPKDNVPGRVSHIYFGQTDEIMLNNHKWAQEFFPVANTENFFYFKKNGLYTVGWHEFEFTLSGQLAENPIEFLEIVTKDVTIDGDNIQFIFESRNELVEIWWGMQTWGQTNAFTFEFIYS